MSRLTPEIIACLDEGIRAMVIDLDARGFQTTDSGDGTKAEVMDCAVDFPMVAVLSCRETMCQDVDSLAQIYPDWTVEGSYAAGISIVILSQCGDTP